MNLILQAGTTIRQAAGESEEMSILWRLQSHPVVHRYANQFNERLLTKLIEHPQEPNAVDWHTEHGDFIFEGLRPKLASALQDLRLSLDVVCGAILLDDRFAVATLHVPETSAYGIAARHGLFNTNPLFDGERFVATPYRALEGYISPSEVNGDSSAPAFELFDGEQLAVEAGLVLKGIFATHSNAIATRDEGRFDAFSANVRDMIEIVEYTRGLLVRLDGLAEEESLISSAPLIPLSES